MSFPNHSGKRCFLECEDECSPIPLKKQKQMKCLDAIRNIKLPFSLEKLQINRKYSKLAADDIYFNKQPSSTKQSQHIRWVLACKFIIASNLRLDRYDVLGMNRNKIPKNMYFYVDHLKNLCALIHEKKNDINTISKNIIEHCNKMETSLIQSYIQNNKNSQCIQQIIDENSDDIEDEDDDLWINTKNNNVGRLMNDNKYNDDDIDIIHIIRIPYIYYGFNMESSFYAICCRIAKQIYIKQDFSNPLFQLLFKNIANFDCFQMSVPMVPCQGDLYAMFTQYALGVYHHKYIKNMILNSKEFTAFLGCFDCWREIERKQKCRKSMHEYWTNIDDKMDINIMKIIIEFADLDQMNNDQILDYIDQFHSNSTKYKLYFNELKTKIPEIESIIDFKRKW